jgi:mevalonate kinase
MTDTVEEPFVAFDAQIESLNQSLHGLNVLIERIRKNPTAFDEEDQRIVKTKIEKYEQEKKMLQNERSKRESMYDKTVKRMEQALQTRLVVLQDTDSETQVLERHPELMELFVQKQTQLTEMLQIMKDKLLSPVEENDEVH